MNYKTTCPMCGGKNYYVTEHNGLSYCYNCGHFERTGSFKPVEPSPHIDVFRSIYQELAEYYHSCVDIARSYLHSRGIDDPQIEQYKIGYCPNDSHLLYTHPLASEAGIIKQKGIPFLGGRIIFPYIVNDEVIDLRGRIIEGDQEKYLSLHQPAHFRGADYAFNADPIAEVDVITEGEIKTILGNLTSFPHRGIPGILSPRTTSKIVSKRQIICFDNQKKNRPELIRAIQKLAGRLSNPFIATLPLRGENKQDIDSYILAYGLPAYETVLRAAIPYSTWKNYL